MAIAQLNTTAGTDLELAVDDVLRNRLVTPLFQPIVDLTDRTVVGVEALARGPEGHALHYPDRLFSAAAAVGRLGEMDMLCAERALEAALAGPAVPLLFVNAEPSVLDQPLSPRLMAMLLGGLPFRMVLEYTERALTTVPGALLRIAEGVHALGNGIALDDVGAEPASLAFLPLIEPEVIKLDMHLLRDPHAPATVETCRIVRQVARSTGATVIAEGIETEDDLVTARSLGATWGQGWLFGRPAPLGRFPFTDMSRGPSTLRPPRPGLHQPTSTPFGAAAEVAEPGRATLDTAVLRITAMAAAVGTGDHAIVLASCADSHVAAEVNAVLENVKTRATYVAVIDPASAAEPFDGEVSVAVVGSDRAEVLCWRMPVDAGSPTVDMVHIRERTAVIAISRMMLQRLG
jgi:EAL domain-containing protein (putative c-di-GMP-specific phosphodiesterase class I)